MKIFTQKGFAHLGVFLLLLVAVIIALVGYKVARNHTNNVSTVSVPKTTAVQTIPTVKSKGDLNTVETTLNNQNIDSDLNPDSLNQDVQALF